MTFILTVLGVVGGFVLFVVVGVQVQELWTRRKMRIAGLFMEWACVERQLRAGEGTLIINHATTVPGKVWWCPKALLPDDKNLASALYDGAFLTVPPWRYRKRANVVRDFPQADVRDNSGGVMGDPEAGWFGRRGGD